jgi:hypothetical protein
MMNQVLGALLRTSEDAGTIFKFAKILPFASVKVKRSKHCQAWTRLELGFFQPSFQNPPFLPDRRGRME